MIWIHEQVKRVSSLPFHQDPESPLHGQGPVVCTMSPGP